MSGLSVWWCTHLVCRRLICGSWGQSSSAGETLSCLGYFKTLSGWRDSSSAGEILSCLGPIFLTSLSARDSSSSLWLLITSCSILCFGVRIFRCIKRSFDWSSCSCRFRFKCSLCYIKTALRSIWVGWGSFSCSGYCSPDLSRCIRSKTNCCRSSRRWWSSGWWCSRSCHELALLHDHLGRAVYSNQHISFTAQRLVSITHLFDCTIYFCLKISAQCSAF